MDEKAIICRYVFTDAEYRKALYCRDRGKPIYRRLLWLAVTFGFVILVTWGLYFEYQDGQLSDAHGLKWSDIISAETPFGLGLIAQLLNCFTPLVSFIYPLFVRGTTNRNKDHLFTLSSDRIMEKTETADSSSQWSNFTAALEDQAGFFIRMGKRHFYWLPKHGFAASDDIDYCRALIQEHIKKFRRLSS